MKTEQGRPSSNDSYSSFSLPSPEELSTPNPRVPTHYSNMSITSLDTIPNISNFSTNLSTIYNHTFKSDDKTPPHRHPEAGMSPMSTQSSSVTTPPLSSSPHSPTEPLRNITNNPHLRTSSLVSSPLNYSNLTGNSSNISCNTSSVSQAANDSSILHNVSSESQHVKSPPSSTSKKPCPSTPSRVKTPVSATSTTPSTPSKPLPFNQEQIDCISDVLIQARDMDKLAKFLNTLPISHLSTDGASEIILRAKCEVAFSKGNFKEVYNILETCNFSSNYHTHLQGMWYKAHYKEAERVRQRPLGKIRNLDPSE